MLFWGGEQNYQNKKRMEEGKSIYNIFLLKLSLELQILIASMCSDIFDVTNLTLKPLIISFTSVGEAH